MIARLVVAILVAIATAEMLKPVGRRYRWSRPVILGVSFLGGVTGALLVNALVFK